MECEIIVFNVIRFYYDSLTIWIISIPSHYIHTRRRKSSSINWKLSPVRQLVSQMVVLLQVTCSDRAGGPITFDHVTHSLHFIDRSTNFSDSVDFGKMSHYLFRLWWFGAKFVMFFSGIFLRRFFCLVFTNLRFFSLSCVHILIVWHGFVSVLSQRTPYPCKQVIAPIWESFIYYMCGVV